MLDIAPATNEVIDEIRRSVAALCEKFPGEYWREQDRERAYPTEFVKALTDAGFLAVLVPEEYGGSGLPISAAAADPLDSAIGELEKQVVHCRAILAFLEQKLQKKNEERIKRDSPEDDDILWG